MARMLAFTPVTELAMTLPSADTALGRMMATLPRAGRVEWLGVRPGRAATMLAEESVVAETGAGLVVDRYHVREGNLGVNFIKDEHLPVIAALTGHPAVAAAMLRRNVVVSGMPLVALKGRRFRIGAALLEGTGPCDPCSRMETALGPGGFNAMRGHGGLCARILEGGTLRVGDAVVAQQD
jgi:MOSC domain-containing protein YiiM